MAGGKRSVWLAAIAGLSATWGACGGGGSSAGDGGSGGQLDHRPEPAFPLFDDTRVHELSLAMSADDWQSIMNDTRGDEWRHATLTYDGVVVEDVGVRPAGESSRVPGNVKMSMRIRFDAFDGRGTFGGYRAINVKGEYDDGSMMRERLALFVFGKMMPTPKSAHARLVVNGDLRGVFTLRQIWDETSVAEHFSQPLGPLYRLRAPSAAVDPYVYLGNDPASYVPLPWDPQIKNAARGDDVVAPFLQAIASNPSPLEDVTDVDDLLTYLAACAIVMTTDGLVGNTGADDHFQYFDPQSGKFFVLPWDPDNSFGSAGEMPDRSIYSKLGRNALVIVIRDQDGYRERYKMKLADAVAAVPLATLQAQADSMYAQIKDAAHEDPVKLFPNDTFDWNLTSIKDFAAARYAAIHGQLGN
jgi:spore coat protein CotH